MFAIRFTDADAVSNQNLIGYEERLFLSETADQEVALSDLIAKAQLQGDLYHSVRHGQFTVSYLRPFSFLVQPSDGHPRRDAPNSARVLCLGEFLKVRDVEFSFSCPRPGIVPRAFPWEGTSGTPTVNISRDGTRVVARYEPPRSWPWSDLIDVRVTRLRVSRLVDRVWVDLAVLEPEPTPRMHGHGGELPQGRR
ncbi:MAG: hypothetical protein JWN86_2651 [Planctomycetota bacterium]|nr:hypothetical protein [Planctomycetota bacterium]